MGLRCGPSRNKDALLDNCAVRPAADVYPLVVQPCPESKVRFRQLSSDCERAKEASCGDWIARLQKGLEVRRGGVLGGDVFCVRVSSVQQLDDPGSRQRPFAAAQKKVVNVRGLQR